MPDAIPTINYPNIIGYITDAQHANISVAQVVATLTPRIVRAGRPFEVIMVIQNASDAPLDVTATLKLPERDQKGQRDRFVAKAERLVIGLEAAEVGYVTLPVTTLPNTAVGANYKINLDIKVSSVGKAKPRRVRAEDGGAPLSADQVPEAAKAHLERLKAMTFTGQISSGLRGTVVELSFNVMAGTIGAIANLSAGWTRLWSVADYSDDRQIFIKQRQLLKEKVLPALDRRTLFAPVLNKTREAFAAGGFPLSDLEAALVAKLLTFMVEYSSPRYGEGTQLTAGIYNIRPYLDKAEAELPQNMTFPHWVSAFLRILHRDARAADHAVKALLHFAYEALLTDAMTRALEMITISTGEDVGTEAERAAYIADVLERLREGRMDFASAYMPLVMGGILVYDMVLADGENPADTLRVLDDMLRERDAMVDSANEPIYDMAAKLVERAQMKYNYRD